MELDFRRLLHPTWALGPVRKLWIASLAALGATLSVEVFLVLFGSPLDLDRCRLLGLLALLFAAYVIRFPRPSFWRWLVASALVVALIALGGWPALVQSPSEARGVHSVLAETASFVAALAWPAVTMRATRLASALNAKRADEISSTL